MHPDIDRFAHVASPIQRWDPRVKISTLLLLIFTIASVQKFPLIIFSLALAFCLTLISHIPLNFIRQRLLPVSIFLFPFFIIMPFRQSANGVSFHLSGFQLALFIYLKAITIVTLVISMIGTTPFNDSMKALEYLKVPPIFVQMILFSYRYLFVFMMEMSRMNTAMKARNFEKKTDMHTVRTVGNFVGSLLVRSFERTERIYQAMLSRGYEGQIVTFFDYQLTKLDYVKGSLVILTCCLLLAGDRFGLAVPLIP